MSKIIRVKDSDQIQCFGDVCGRCGGRGEIDTLGIGQSGICPVCKGQGNVQRFEGQGNQNTSSSMNRQYADGVQVSSISSTRRR